MKQLDLFGNIEQEPQKHVHIEEQSARKPVTIKKKKESEYPCECENCKYRNDCDIHKVKRNSVGMCCEFRHFLAPDIERNNI